LQKLIEFIRRKYLLKMQAPEELTAVANDEIMNNMRWELSIVGLNTGEINQQVDALIEDNYQLPTEEAAASTVNWEPQPTNKGWGSVRFEYTYDQIGKKQRDTPVPAGTCCLGTPKLASSKMEVVLRERKRTQTIRKGKHEQMQQATKTTCCAQKTCLPGQLKTCCAKKTRIAPVRVCLRHSVTTILR
jgi:hypothetical protein